MADYLVTGGAGFIGSHLVHRLVKLEHRVRVLDNFSTGKRENLDEEFADVYAWLATLASLLLPRLLPLGDLDPEKQQRVLAQNCIDLYGLDIKL